MIGERANEESKQPPKSKASLILDSIFATAPPELKSNYIMLLLGATGQGKTAFLNFLFNAEHAMRSIDGIKSCRKFNIKEVENKEGGKMVSRTSEAVRYELKIGHVKLTIIDTPGFGDSRGTEVDSQNFDKIKQIILEEGGINCVCVIQNGREARMNTQLKYSYSSLTSILPKAISDQIIIVYTNCERQNQMNFHHHELNKLFGFADDHYIPSVCIDNPLVFVEKAQKSMKKMARKALHESVLQDLLQQFEISADSFKQFFDKLQSFPLVKTLEFSNLYDAKKEAENRVIEAQIGL